MKIVKHHLGAYDANTGQQCCVICGKAIVDYSQGVAFYPPIKKQMPSWPEGPLYEAGKNPTAKFTELTEEYLQEGDELINCNEI